MAALELRASRLVRARDAASGQRGGFGDQGMTQVVSARWVQLIRQLLTRQLMNLLLLLICCWAHSFPCAAAHHMHVSGARKVESELNGDLLLGLL